MNYANTKHSISMSLLLYYYLLSSKINIVWLSTYFMYCNFADMVDQTSKLSTHDAETARSDRGIDSTTEMSITLFDDG